MRVLLAVVIFISTAGAQTPEDYLKQGDSLARQNKNSSALVAYQAADQARPNDAEILRRIAKQLSELMATEPDAQKKKELGHESLVAAQKAKSLAPRNAKVRLSLAIVAGRVALTESPRRQVELSRLIKEETEASLALDPNDGLAWHVLARWNFEVANFNAFLISLASIFFGKLPEASNERAIECFQKAISLGPPRLSNHAELGRAYARAGMHDMARQQLQKALDMPSIEREDDETKARARQALGGL